MISAIGVKPGAKDVDGKKKSEKPVIDLTVNSGTLRYLTTTRRFLSMAVGLILLVIGLVVGVIWPQTMTILELQGSVTKQDKLVSQLQLKEQQLLQLPNSPTFAQVDKVNQVLPSKKPLLELLTSINKAVTTSGVSVSAIELAPGSIATSAAELAAQAASKRQTQNKEYDKVDVTITTRGTLDDINQLFQQLETSAPLSSVSKITLNKAPAKVGLASGPTPTEGEFEAQLVITTYFFTRSIASALESPLPPIGATEEQVLRDIVNYDNPAAVPQQGIISGQLNDLFSVQLLEAVQEEQ